MLIALIGLLIAWNCDDGRRGRAGLLAQLKGYSGCWCDDCVRNVLGVRPASTRRPFNGSGAFLSGTMAMCLGVTLVFVAARRPALFVRLARRRISDPSQCKNCGYDLTGLGERSRCPECGEK